ncbi:MAG: hypothetical protein ACI9VR_000852 [Cognaticolwellia sp.]|jgi:hypothetical protein
MQTTLLQTWLRLLEDAGFSVTFRPQNDQIPYDAITFGVLGGEGAGSAIVHINFLPMGSETRGTLFAQVVAQLPQTIAPDCEPALLEVANLVNQQILLGNFMSGPGGVVFWRHTFYMAGDIAPEVNTRMVDQMMGLLLQTLHTMWEPLALAATGLSTASEALEMVRERRPAGAPAAS